MSSHPPSDPHTDADLPTDAHDKLSVVSHRLPMTYTPDHGWQRSPGGLVSAVAPALRDTRARWFGHVARGTPAPPSGTGHRLVGLPVSPHLERNALDGFCNRTLWPALHGLSGKVEELDDWWRAYRNLAERTARRVARATPIGGTVWLQDYHFYGVPEALKRLRTDLRIGLFCHTPVAADTLEQLRDAAALARSLASADFIGVQTSYDGEAMRRFLSPSAESLPTIHVDPVGIDTAHWQQLRSDPLVESLTERHLAVPGSLVVGVDRLDYTKGIAHKLLAIETLLDNRLVDPDDFRFIQIAVPTRTGVPIYGFVRDQVLEIERRINNGHPRTDGVPVVHVICEQRAPREVAALYRAADVALVTPVCDGLNLVAVEFSVINADRDCELVLSVGAGACETIGHACLTVDGADVISVAAGLRAAIAGPTDRHERAQQRGVAALALDSRSWFERCRRQFSVPVR
ncbi:MAG: trehalose-6-phosphate synthase [Acidimicrobiales bacterium]